MMADVPQSRFPLRRCATILLAAALLTGCGHSHDDGHSHDHGHGEESPSGASFKAGTGVIVTDETRNILGVEVAEISERALPAQVRFNLQIFGEKHLHSIHEDDHSGCDVHGSGFLPPEKAAILKAGQLVQIQTRDDQTIGGVVLAVEPALALDEFEVVVGATNATDKLKPGEFLSAVVTLPRENVSIVVPRSAVLRTSEGPMVYAVNGDAYFRTPVEVGMEADGWVEITDGLFTGDAVVTRPVETLWLIELRATKGGGHCH